MVVHSSLARLVSAFALALAALLPACSSSSSSSGPSTDQACADSAKARCTKESECSTYWFQVRSGADEANCEAREKIYCLNAIAASSVSKTVASTEACVAAYATYTCADWLANSVPAACVPKPGGLANAAACAFSGQCQSDYCEIPQGFACGKCAPPTQIGDSCASTGLCTTETTGQYCSTATSKCTAPIAQGGACDGNGLLCIGGLACQGLTTTSNGTCQPSVTMLGADCTSTGQGGVGCDRHHGLQCDGTTKKCVAMTFAAAGQPCGTISGHLVPCTNEGFCLVPMGQTAGTCVAAAPDGAACDLVMGPGCAYRSTCVVSSGTSGTCTPISAATCH